MDSPSGLLLSDDLIFSSRILGTAREFSLSLKTARSMSILLRLAQEQRPTCILLDLGNPGLVLPELMTQLRATCSLMPRVLAYGSHVDAAALKAAREAGCDPVLPRSKFVEELPLRLADWFEQKVQSSPSVA